jgi:hypothetical protein
MANINNKPVSIKVSKLYFDKVFEPDRKRLGVKIGRNFTQKEYTEFLARKKLKIKVQRSNKFAPRGFRL